MAVIKCYNCENEISDTEIVCPYCDYPVSLSKKYFEDEKETSSLKGDTVKTSKSEIERSLEESDSLHQNEEIPVPTQEIDQNIESDISEDGNIEENSEKEPDLILGNTMKISKDEISSIENSRREEEIQSDTLRRSLEERKAEREKINGRKDKKIIILTTTIIGIFLVIYLVASVFTKIVGEGLFKGEKPNKKANKEVSSAAEVIDLGFEFRSHTLTIIDEEIISTDYQPNEEKPWKEYRKDVTNLTIADGIKTIGAYAFDDLSNLRHVTLAPSVEVIGNSAFYACSKLEKLAFDVDKSSLEIVGDYAFTDCSALKTITFPDSLTKIGEGAFKSCKNLEKVVIPDSCQEIGADAFLGCHKIVIVCSKDSVANEYATENGIEVELTDAEEEEEKEEEEKEETTPSEEQNKEPSQKPQKDDKKENEPVSSEQSDAEKLESLLEKLPTAKSEQEKDEILKQIDKLLPKE